MLGPACFVSQLIARLSKPVGNKAGQGRLFCNLGGLVLDVVVEHFVLFCEPVCIGPCLVVHGKLAGCSERGGAVCCVRYAGRAVALWTSPAARMR
jgi:hypothetical protein